MRSNKKYVWLNTYVYFSLVIKALSQEVHIINPFPAVLIRGRPFKLSHFNILILWNGIELLLINEHNDEDLCYINIQM